jgi:hypothetical protein
MRGICCRKQDLLREDVGDIGVFLIEATAVGACKRHWLDRCAAVWKDGLALVPSPRRPMNDLEAIP